MSTLPSHLDLTNGIRPQSPVLRPNSISAAGLTNARISRFLPCTFLQEEAVRVDASHALAWRSRRIPLRTQRWNVATIKYAWQQVAAQTSVLRAGLQLTGSGAECSISHAIYDAPTELMVLNKSEADKAKVSASVEEARKQAGAPVAVLFVGKHVRAVAEFHLFAPAALLDEHSLNLISQDLHAVMEGRPVLQRPVLHRYLATCKLRASAEDATSFWRSAIPTSASSQVQLTGEVKSKSPGRFERNVRCLGDLLNMAAANNVRPTSILEAAWAVTVTKHSGVDAVVFATGHRDEPFPDSDRLVGFLECTVPIHVSALDTTVLIDVIQGIDEFHTTVTKHAVFGSRSIMDMVGMDSTPQSRLVFGDPSSRCSLGGSYDVQLSFDLTRTGTHLSITVDYAGQCQLEKVEILVDHFVCCLEDALLTDASKLVSEVRLASAEEEHSLLQHGEAAHLSRPRLVHHLFEEQCEKDPDALAIECLDGRAVTFGRLGELATNIEISLRQRMEEKEERRASIATGTPSQFSFNGAATPLSARYHSDELAHKKALSARFETGLSGSTYDAGYKMSRLDATHSIVIPVAMDISIEFIATLIGIMKAGCAYAILDPTMSATRNALAIADVAADMVVCNRHYAYQFENPIAVDDLLADGSSTYESCSFASGDVDVESLAYVIFTSGSTGRPKAVAVSHRSASNGIAHFKSGHENLRSLLFYNPIFSAAQRTILATLITGGVLCLAPRSLLGESLGEVIHRMNISNAGMTASTAALLRPEHVRSLRQLTLTGEKITAGVLQHLNGQVNIRNAYGLSEVQQLNMGRALTTLADASSCANVGRPKDTTTSYVLIPGTTRLSPFLVPGELCLGGGQVSSGYLNEPDLSQRVFINNPFSERPNDLLYRTGDLAVVQANGSIQLIGRIDSQVKINGQRVEVDEVATVLQRQPGVAAVGVVGAQLGAQRLVAFIQADRDLAGSEDKFLKELRSAAMVALPAYMVPSLWKVVEKLPLSPSGKVAIGVLRTLALENFRAGQDIKAVGGDESKAMTPREEKLAIIWAKVLGLSIDSISPHSNFADVGGSSLDAMRVAMDAADHKLDVTAGSVLEANSLSDLAASITESESSFDPAPFSAIHGDRLSMSSKYEDAWPVTPMQEGVLVATLSGSEDYLYQRHFDISGVDADRLKTAFDSVIKARPIWRSTFEQRGELLVQAIVPADRFVLEWQEVRGDVKDFLKSDKQRSVDFGSHFIRVAIVNQTDLIVSAHHALFDHWSQRFLFDDVSTAFFALRPLVPRAPFSKFVRALQAQDTASSANFWRQRLQNAEPTILAPRDVTGQASVVNETCEISRRVVLPFAAIEKSTGLTTGVLVYAAWAIILSRHTGVEQPTFAVTLSGRDHFSIPGSGAMDGPTLAVMPFRVDVGGAESKKTLQQIATETRAALWQAAEHSQFGMRNAVACSGVDRSTPLMDSMVNILLPLEQDVSTTSLFKPAAAKRMWNSEYQTLEFRRVAADICEVAFSSTLGAKRTSYILDQLLTVLRPFSESPDSIRCTSLQLLGRTEALELEGETPRVPDSDFLIGAFEKTAREEPDLLALQWLQEEFVTYRQLDQRANQMANWLISAGLCVGDRVPIMVEKSIDSFVAILGVLKAGAAYVPMSHEAPGDRLSGMMNQVEATVVLTTAKHAHLVTLPGVRAIAVEEVPLGDQPITKPCLSDHSPYDTAYIIHTSGSTGAPKGVVISHAAAASAISSMIVAEGRVGNCAPWRVLQFAQHIFDASVQDIFNTLSSRGCLVMAPTDEMYSDIASVINRLDIHQAILTPTVARMFTPKQVPGFRKLILGGEPMSPDIIDEWASAVDLLNVYGPTEASMVTTTKIMRAGEDSRNIGAPLSTAAVRVLDPEGKSLVPFGAVGELCISGPQLAQGYNRRPDLTDQAFIMLGSVRFYRTGDLVRQRADGDLLCLARKDGQVKVHGHRIELGEIERVAQGDAAVVGAVVLLDKSHGQESLVIFVRFTDHTEMVQEASIHLMNTLRAKLPGYMLPKFLIVRASFPLLPSRKTDRKTLQADLKAMRTEDLAAHAVTKLEINGESVSILPVEGESQLLLQSCFAELFAMPASLIGSNSSFLSLGGDSVMAIKLVGKLRQAGFLLSVSDVVADPMLAAIAARAKRMATDVIVQPFVPSPTILSGTAALGLSMDNVEDIFPCPPGQAEFLDQGRRPEQFWRAMVARKVPSDFDIAKWTRVTAALTARNPLLRSTFCKVSPSAIETDPRWHQIVLTDVDLPLEEVVCADEAEREAAIAKLWSLDFKPGELYVAYRLLRLANGQIELVIKLDHGCYDGQLLRVFDDQFRALWHGQEKLQPPETNFTEFALNVWRSDVKKSLNYWRDLLRLPESAAQQAPCWPAVASPMAENLVTCLFDGVTESLSRLAHRNGVTVAIIFQAAFQCYLASKQNNGNVAFDLLATGRDLGGLEGAERIDGTCANFMPFVLGALDSGRGDDTAALESHLKATQQRYWEVSDHANVSLDDIYGQVGGDISTVRQSLSNQSLFLFQPFEPSRGPVDHNRWLVMAGSEVRLVQPYALVVEASKTLTGFRLKAYFDKRLFPSNDVAKDEVLGSVIKTIQGWLALSA